MDESDPARLKETITELKSFDKKKRRSAVMRLGMIGGEKAIRALILTLMNDHEDLITRSRAALMLGKLRDPRAVEPLIQALTAPGLKTPVYAAEALGKIGDKRAVLALEWLVSTTHSDTTKEAAKHSLTQIGYVIQQADPVSVFDVI